MKLIGKGLIIDAGRGVDFPDYGDLELSFGLSVLNIPAPAATGGYVVPYDAPVTGRIGWYDLSAELLAAVTGNAAAAGTVRRAESEPHDVPVASPYTITLAYSTPVALTDVVVRDDGVRMTRVAAGPAAGQYVIAEATLTFNAADAGRRVYVDYFYAQAGVGHQVVVSPFALPAEFKLAAALKLYDTAVNEYAGELVATAEHCRRTGPLAVGARAGQFGSFGFEFAVENRAPGDLVLYFP